MQDVKDVLFVLNQMVENLCIENPKCNQTETEKKPFLTINKDPNQVSPNCSYNEISHEDSIVLKNFYENREEITITTLSDFENVYAKLCSSAANVQHKKYGYFETCLEHLDETVNKCNIPYTRKKELFKRDMFVQTICHPRPTSDNFCQCDLIPQDSSAFPLAEYPSKKKIKLNSSGYSYLTYKRAQWQLGTSEFPQGEYEPFGNKTNHSDSFELTSCLKRTSRIRVGLSKRYKLRNK